LPRTATEPNQKTGSPAPFAPAPAGPIVAAGPPSGPPSSAASPPTASIPYVEPTLASPARSRPSKNLVIGLVAAAVLLLGAIVISAAATLFFGFIPSPLVDFFLELCALPSPSGKERAVTDRVTAYLSELGLDWD